MTITLDTSNVLDMTLGQRVAYARKLADKLSARELAGLAGLGSRGHVEGLESGRTDNPTRATIVALAHALGCSSGWLVDGEGDAPTEDAVRLAVEAARASKSKSSIETTEGAA